MIASFLKRQALRAKKRGDWFNAMRWANLHGMCSAFGPLGALEVMLHQAWEIYQALNGTKKLKDKKLQEFLDRASAKKVAKK